MNPDPVRNDARKAVRQRRLGPDAACALCGERRPEALTPVKGRPMLNLTSARNPTGSKNSNTASSTTSTMSSSNSPAQRSTTGATMSSLSSAKCGATSSPLPPESTGGRSQPSATATPNPARSIARRF